MNLNRKLFILFAAVGLLCTCNPVNGTEHASFQHRADTDIRPYEDTIVVSKRKTNKKHRIKLYPDVNHKVLFFTATGNASGNYQLFLFDVEGQLVRQANIKDKQVTLINKIPAGIYLFEVFSEDERLESGQVFVSQE